MSRVEKFRQARLVRIKCILLFMLFFLIAVAGLCVSDYSINSVMKNEKAVKLITFRNISNAYLEVNFLSKKTYINIKYIIRDYQKIKNKIKKFGHTG
ncbi:MAG: hypothetical protein N3B21_08005 [Clostridia bacterium]|nr:hypothetical protein [Clostridia bacterium]